MFGFSLDLILFIADNVFPVFIIIGIGFLLRRLNIINANFCSIANQLIFLVSLPAFIFMEMLKLDVNKAFDVHMIGYAYLGTFLTIALAWIAARLLKMEAVNIGAFVQGSFRGNLAIIGLALIQNIGGTPALGKASVALAFVLPLYNVVAIIILSIPGNRTGRKAMYKKVLKDIAVNPLLIALAGGIILSLARAKLPGIAHTSINYLASLSLPLALIGIGGSLSKESLQATPRLAMYSTLIKVLISPVILTVGAYYLGFTGIDLLILYIVFGAPTAIISYVMAEAMGSNGGLASSIILLTTLFSVFTISAAVFVMKALHIL